MANEISNTADFLDTRAIEDRIRELTGDIEAFEDPESDPADFDADDIADARTELAKLLALKEQVGEYLEWSGGNTLIHESYMSTYAKEHAEDINGIDTSAWPFDCIDWEKATEDFKVDYTSVDFDGETYYVR